MDARNFNFGDEAPLADRRTHIPEFVRVSDRTHAKDANPIGTGELEDEIRQRLSDGETPSAIASAMKGRVSRSWVYEIASRCRNF